MTTIAFKAGILAADSAVYDEGVYSGTMTKLARAANGHIAGTAGEAAPCAEFLDWFKRDFGKPEKVASINKAAAAMIITTDGTVLFLDPGNPAYPIKGEFHAIGSGARIALGAMAAGMGAEDAVRIACDLDDGSGGPVEVLRLVEREETADEKAYGGEQWTKEEQVEFQRRMRRMAARTDKWANAVRHLPRNADALAAAILRKQQQILRVKEDGASVEELEFELSELKRHMNAGVEREALLSYIRETWKDASAARKFLSGPGFNFYRLGNSIEGVVEYHKPEEGPIEALYRGRRFVFPKAHASKDDLGPALEYRPRPVNAAEPSGAWVEREAAIDRMVLRKDKEEATPYADAMRYAREQEKRVKREHSQSFLARFRYWVFGW